MNREPAPLLVIRRNDDGTYSVIGAGRRLIKAGFKSHDEAKRWRDDRLLDHLRDARSQVEKWGAR